MNPVRRQSRVQRSGESADGVNRGRVGIHGPHVEAATQEIRKIASRATARVEYPPPTVESTAQQLIEQIDIDVTELRGKCGRPARRIGLWHPVQLFSRDPGRSKLSAPDDGWFGPAGREQLTPGLLKRGVPT